MTDRCIVCGGVLTPLPRLTDGYHWVCLDCESKRRAIANPLFAYTLHNWWHNPDILSRQWWRHRKWRKELGL